LIGLSGVEEDLKSLNEKLERMMQRLDYLEALLTDQRLLGVRRYLERTPESRDDVSRIILNALALKGPMNISQMTREVTGERGSASRVTVRKRVNDLLEEGVIEKGEGFEYRLSVSKEK
jgi:hypothetical protein